ncbi:MAG TPA: PQQ-binding-like beta-propeller repeat protein [Candidatus Acidoferrum sp.]|nr:PQQ-binding-like beta-propeller repeat protein [Candidatus Acidoferrum sp.]
MDTGKLIIAISALGAAHLFAASADENWGQWRGPSQNGVAPKADPPTEWSESKNVKWKFKLAGEGSASPIVWDNYVFVQSAVPAAKKPDAKLNIAPQFAGQQQPPPNDSRVRPREPGAPDGAPRRRGPGGPAGGFGGGAAPKDPFQFTLIAIDRTSGKPAWQKVLREEVPHEGHHQSDGTFASASPIADADGVYAYFGSRGLYALDHKGNVKWQKDLGKARMKNAFGEGSSPALHGNTLVVNWDHEGDDFIVAFDKRDGKELWRQPRSESTSWSTPLIVNASGTAQVVVNASDKVRSYDLTSGKELWSVGPLTPNAIPSAVAGNGLIYCMSGFRGAALFAIKPGKIGDIANTDAIAWTYNKDTPYVPSPLLYEDRLYFFKGNEATLTILDAKAGTALVEAQRLEGARGVYASPIGAAGRVYIVGRDGGALVLKKGDKAEVLATNKLDDRFDASPAAVGKELYLRGRQYLYCIAPTERAELK